MTGRGGGCWCLPPAAALPHHPERPCPARFPLRSLHHDRELDFLSAPGIPAGRICAEHQAFPRWQRKAQHPVLRVSSIVPSVGATSFDASVILSRSSAHAAADVWYRRGALQEIGGSVTRRRLEERDLVFPLALWAGWGKAETASGGQTGLHWG
ncbi:hypothetical protein B0H13DRAFT_2298742 [Mycena leptocephala]|nr:hypothetical protein B0H13DRAFT_2298742 [Mycena leptocephala]